MPDLSPATGATRTERRRSHRVRSAIPLEVALTRAGGVQVSERAVAEVLNARGALLRIKARLPIPTQLAKPTDGRSHLGACSRFLRAHSKGIAERGLLGWGRLGLHAERSLAHSAPGIHAHGWLLRWKTRPAG